MWDVVVVGAGPAGVAAALAATTRAPQARVALLDRSGFPRDKACGDGVAPHVLDVLAEHGVTGILDDKVPVHRLRLGFPDGPGVAGRMARAAYVVPRVELDARLLDAALARGVPLIRHRVRRVHIHRDSLVLDGEIRARVVVAADGAYSVLRRAIGAPLPAGRGRALALRGYAPVQSGRETEQVIVFARGAWPAYAWSFPIGDGRANVGYGQVLGAGGPPSRADLVGRLDELLPGVTDGATGWRGHHLPLSSSRPRQPDGRVLLVGDAASLVNPITGEGIYYAVLSGALAGAAAVDQCDDVTPGASYRRALEAALGRHLRHTAFAARLARHPSVVNAAVRSAADDAGVFDDLVEVGLGRGRLTPRVLRGIGSGLVRAS